MLPHGTFAISTCRSIVVSLHLKHLATSQWAADDIQRCVLEEANKTLYGDVGARYGDEGARYAETLHYVMLGIVRKQFTLFERSG